MVKPVIFLDRDGVINEDIGHLSNKDNFKFIENSLDAIKLLNNEGFRTIIITNQSIVARGICSEEEVIFLNNHLEEIIYKNGAIIDKTYFCPHHPDSKKGIIEKYNIDCNCRKPKPGMILQAQKDFQIKDLSKCFFIGDKTSDILSGINAGCKTILVETGYSGKDKAYNVFADYKTKDLYSAVKDIILGER